MKKCVIGVKAPVMRCTVHAVNVENMRTMIITSSFMFNVFMYVFVVTARTVCMQGTCGVCNHRQYNELGNRCDHEYLFLSVLMHDRHTKIISVNG